KRTALDLSSPSKIAVEMVEHEREMPGNSAATACARPMMNESLKVTDLPVLRALSAKYSSRAVTRSRKPTKRKLENKSSKVSLRNRPTNAAGTMERTIVREKFNSAFQLN